MKATKSKRILSVILCLALIIGYLPLAARAAENAVQGKADPSTMNSWKDLFLSDTLSTENAGAVWTDKSVFTDGSAFAGTGISKNDADSFLVALSTIASNMAVTGMSNVPTDTMLVLDVSGSMNKSNSDVAEELVEAANDSIQALLNTNRHNRVGVVLYSGPRTQGGSTSNSDAVLILPMGRYTTGKDGQYLNYINNGSESVKLDSDVVYEGTTGKPNSVSKTVVGATYIQKGLALAAAQFTASTNTTTVEDPILGTVKRTPVLVLMSDGAPTVASTGFTNPGTIQLGDGTKTSAAIGFVTQLTAAYTKAQIEAKYGTDALVYTLGLGTTKDSVASSVLNPAKSSTAINDFWKQYNGASVDETVTVQGKGNNARKVTKIAQALEQRYVEKYFPVDSDSDDLARGLKKAFADIVGTIQLQSRYFPTLVVGNEDLSGYVSFVDKIGQYMEVTDIKGVLIDNILYSGAELAKNFASNSNGGELGTYDHPTALGNEMVAAVRARLGLASDDAARTLIGLAYEHGQLSYTDANNFSNYIGWYANAAGEFLGFWAEDVTAIPEATGNADTDPVFTVKSYGYLGEVDESYGVAASDMMYATVQVRENIATGEQTVAFAVPAALIPLVSYQVTLNQNGTLSGLKAAGAEHPIRLVYEVALDGDIDPFTLTNVVSKEYLAANTNADGSVNFYTNQYEVDNTTGYNKQNTYSYFNPSHQNEHYYYLTDTPIYADTNGTLYTGKAQPSGAFYRAYPVYIKAGASLRIETHYRRISAASLATALQAADGSWYIPAGDVHTNLDGYTVGKQSNVTGTLGYVNVPFVDAKNHSVGEIGYNFYVGATLGNNGKLTVAPATGIALSKVMAPGAQKPTSAFRFVITNETDPADTAEYPVQILHADGSRSVGVVKFTNGKATVALNAGETLYIGGMEAGAVYTVEEEETLEYLPEAAKKKVTVVGGQLAKVDFINADRGTGNLTVTKEVYHNFGSGYVIPGKKFTVQVQLSGIGTANAQFQTLQSDGTDSVVNTDANGIFTVELAHDEQITILGLPEGTVATVTEPNPGTGFTAAYWEGTQLADGVVTVADGVTEDVIVVNSYDPKEVYPVNVVLNGTKDYTNPGGWNGATFEFQLQKWANDTWTTIATETVTEANPNFDFDDVLSKEKFEQPGTYYYQVLETNGGSTVNGITYDATLHTFGIVVTDKDMDGRLEITQVISYHSGKEFEKNPNGDWQIDITFHNVYQASGCGTTLDVRKDLVNRSGSSLVSKAGFRFGLYDAQGKLVASSELTDGLGNSRILLNYSHGDVGEYIYTLKEIIPGTKVPGMTYDETTYAVKVQVSDNGDGTTSARVVSIDGKESFETPVFTNIYAPAAAELPLHFVGKELTGRDQKPGEFTFEVYDVNGKLVTAGTNDRKGNVIFDQNLKFDAVGPFVYTIRETTPDGNGITTDKTVYTVMVTVTDENGILTASHSVLNVVGGVITFRNTYKPAETQYTFHGTKTLLGRVLLNDEFTFLLKEVDEEGIAVKGGVSLQAKNYMDGSFHFPAISYTEAGTYYYRISEQTSSSAAYGIHYDQTQYLVTVTVKDNQQKGLLEVDQVEMRVQGGEQVQAIAFTNKYIPSPTSAQIPGNKVLEGKVLNGGDFRFNLHESNENWDSVRWLETVENGSNGSFTFANIEALSFRSAGTWYYLITEEHGGEVVDGITYDDTVYRVMIEVTDDLIGQLHATVHIYDSEGIPQQSVEFRNIYAIAGDAQVTLEGTKTLTGKELGNEKFTFELFETGGDFTITGSAIQSAENTGKNFSLTLSYGAEDVGSTFYYVVKEKNAGQTINGITYSNAAYYVTVAVQDNGSGGIETVTTITDGANSVNSLDFVNRYNVAGNAQVTLEGTKTLIGKKLGNEKFTFELFQTGADFAITGSAIQSAENTGKNFSLTLNYGAEDAGSTFYYVVKEKNAGQTINGITYSSAAYYVTVKVNDNGTGGIETVTTITDGTNSVNSLDFVNRYNVAGNAQVTLEGTKTLIGKELGNEKFTFELFKTGADFAITGSAIQSAENTGKDFSLTLNYGAEDAGSTFYYVVKEKNAGQTINGITYSNAAYYVTVAVQDNGTGGIETVTTITDGTNSVNSLDFVNTYAAAGTGIVLEGTKTLTCKELTAGEFTFELYETEADFVIAGDAILTAVNGADGSIRFEEIPFEKTGLYYFVMKENTDAQLENITYDASVYQIVVEVIDNGLGNLEAKVAQILKVTDSGEEAAEAITFANVYTPDPEDLLLDIIASKTVENTGSAVIGPKGFRFLLENVTLSGEQTAESNEDGLAAFHLTFTEDDIGKTYIYKLSEINDGRQNVTYSEAVYNISITISLSENNTLVATVLNEEGAVFNGVGEFVNVYHYTPSDNPKTGDSQLFLWVAVMAVSAGSVLTLTACKGKKKEEA